MLWLDANKLIPAGGLVIAYGKPGSHKTGIALALSAELVSAGRRVLYLAGEGAQGIETARWPTLLRHLRTEPEAVKGIDGRSATRYSTCCSSTQARLDAIKDLTPDLIALDVLSLFIKEGDWNTPHVAGGIMATLRRLTQHTGAAVLAWRIREKESKHGIIGSYSAQKPRRWGAADRSYRALGSLHRREIKGRRNWPAGGEGAAFGYRRRAIRWRGRRQAPRGECDR